ncbi:MAG: tRNA (adenosine(37)-N6)-threonylcarbamoyltransferase complex ATPase subunit type 1 TsaE [Pedobacter sp.]|nr:MAG: tRNA (adenosine(37)-N6)-threonylcarbamoyltransferase complex ATPase subunit type 1 TsaE [Pedobacter sp.]
MEVIVKTISELPEVAQKLLDFSGTSRFFIFEGDMGAGKTTFIKALCEKLGVKDVVSSPTFSLVNEYASDKGPVYHFDFYRLKNIHEAYDIGYEEYFYGEGICLVEWPDKVSPLLPDSYIKVSIVAPEPEKRTFSFNKNGENI